MLDKIQETEEKEMEKNYEFKLGEIMQELRNIDKNITEIKENIKCLNDKMDKQFIKVDEKMTAKLEEKDIRSIIRDEIRKYDEEKLNTSSKKVSIINGLIGIGRFIFAVTASFAIIEYFL